MARKSDSVVFLDTHIVVWLYDALVEKLSGPARTAIERSTALRVSPMVRLELQYLFEIGRVRAPPGEILDELARSIGLRESDPKMAPVIQAALSIDWTRDTFDRLIVAEARVARAGLVKKDRVIREHDEMAVW